MRLTVFVCFLYMIWGCSETPQSNPFQEVDIKILYEDTVSIRALEWMPGSVGFAGSTGLFGSVDLQKFNVRTSRISHLDSYPEFRAVAHTASDFFILSAGDPALLYKTGDTGQMELVYSESDPEVFYDSMGFWDDLNGIAVGDAMNGCMSILISRDGGNSWSKIPCDQLPVALPGEGAFAASDTNIAFAGESCWIISNKGRIYSSPDKGANWEVLQSPVNSVAETFGLYSLAFYDEQTGYAAGGDYTEPEANTSNKTSTSDGGKTWVLRASGHPPGYMSCVQYVPGRGGRDLVAVSYKGISYSSDFGNSWRSLGTEGFYSFRFANDSTAIASGNGKIARLLFK